MPRSTRNRLITIFAVLFVMLGGYLLISSIQPARSASGGSHPDIDAFEPYLHYLHEFTERRRVNVYFRNEQSIFYGAQVNFVNTGRGNLTFVRRDLVTAGRVPLMVARVYDSSGLGSEEFGDGWHLSAAETIEVQDDTAKLRSETGASGGAGTLSWSKTTRRTTPCSTRPVEEGLHCGYEVVIPRSSPCLGPLIV